MTINNKRRPGRPHGASRYRDQDRALLTRVATVIAEEAGLGLTAAIRRFKDADESELRRLRRKWKENGRYLADALEHRRVRAEGVQALAASLGGVQSYLRNLDPAVVERASRTLVQVDQAVRQAAVGLARWAEANSETLDRIRDAQLGFARYIAQNPTMMQIMQSTSPKVLEGQRQIVRAR